MPIFSLDDFRIQKRCCLPFYSSCWFSSFKKFSNKDIDLLLLKFRITPIMTCKILDWVGLKGTRLLVQVKRDIVGFQVMFTANKVNLWFVSWWKPNSRNCHFWKYQILCMILKTELSKFWYGGTFQLLTSVGSDILIFDLSI